MLCKSSRGSHSVPEWVRSYDYELKIMLKVIAQMSLRRAYVLRRSIWDTRRLSRRYLEARLGHTASTVLS
jgi:hypothetical protein